MSEIPLLSADGFQKVKYKKPKRPINNKTTNNFIEDDSKKSVIDLETAIRRIEVAKSDLQSSDIYKSIKALLRESLGVLKNPTVKEIVCFGLGKIELYAVVVYAYDPVFGELERDILKHFECSLLVDNLEGKYKVQEKNTTLFYLPHCPKQLSNNLLWANWGLDLNYCVIISNSFSTIIENSSYRQLQKTAEYISLISPHVVEFSVINDFKYFEIFNDTAIHVFPWDKLSLLSDDLWKIAPEPNYSEEDLEFITKKALKNEQS